MKGRFRFPARKAKSIKQTEDTIGVLRLLMRDIKNVAEHTVALSPAKIFIFLTADPI